MPEIHRAKNYEGLLALVAEATRTLRENLPLLARTQDNDSVMATHQTHDILADMEFLGRDLAAGLVDLEASPFDRRAHRVCFTDSDLILASDPDRRRSSGRRREDLTGTPEPAPIQERPLSEERTAFGFSGDLKSEEQHRAECPEYPQELLLTDESTSEDLFHEGVDMASFVGEAPDLLAGIDTSEPTYDDAPTVPILEA